MRIVLLAGVLAACASRSTQQPIAPTSKLQLRVREAGLARLVEATGARDPDKVLRMFDGKVSFGGAWFQESTCRARLSAVGSISGANLGELARCIATLPLVASDRVSAHPEIALVTYPPGIELEVLFGGTVSDPKLKWIGYVSRAAVGDALPTVSQRAFEGVRIDPQPLVLDGEMRAKVAAEHATVKIASKPVFSWFKVCIDAGGAVTSVHPRATSSLVAQRVHEASVRAWKLRPFMIGTQAIPICSLVRVGDVPDDRDVAATPIPAPTARPEAVYVTPWLLQQVAGDRRLVPDDLDKVRIAESGVTVIVGIVHLCIDAQGAVESLSLLRSTGVAGYDRKLLDGIRGWRYRPAKLDDAPIPVCTAVSFVYSQR